MSNRTSYILLIVLGIPFLIVGGFLLYTGTSVILHRYRPGYVATLAEAPFDYWFGVLLAFLPGVWLTFSGVRGLLKGRRTG
jgi:hypothetical protein